MQRHFDPIHVGRCVRLFSFLSSSCRTIAMGSSARETVAIRGARMALADEPPWSRGRAQVEIG